MQRCVPGAGPRTSGTAVPVSASSRRGRSGRDCGPAGQDLGVRVLPPVFLPPETLLPRSRDSGGAYLRAVVLGLIAHIQGKRA